MQTLACALLERGGARLRECAVALAELELLSRAGVFLLCLCLTLGFGALHKAKPPDSRARVAVWLSDRDGDCVVGLDGNLLQLRTVPMRAPIEVEARADGGVWVLSAPSGDPLGVHQLSRVTASGALALALSLAPALDLSSDEHDRALVVELTAAGERVRMFDADGAEVWNRDWPGALCAAARGGMVLVGCANGQLALFDLAQPSSAPSLSDIGGVLSDVAAGPRPGTWWGLDAQGASRLLLLDAQAGVLWSRGIGLHALHLAPVDGVERVWIADATQAHVRRFGPQGVLEIDRADMPLGGLDRACAFQSGAALFAAPGALLHLDALGRGAPGQAGFDFLVDVSVVR
jgi:hypothetical protein